MQAASVPVILYTDHMALLSILQGESYSTRIASWQLRLGEYNLDIVHVMGTENGLADGLSRKPIGALDIGLIGKEQSYLSTMAVIRDDSGGFLLRKSDGREKSAGEGDFTGEKEQNEQRVESKDRVESDRREQNEERVESNDRVESDRREQNRVREQGCTSLFKEMEREQRKRVGDGAEENGKNGVEEGTMDRAELTKKWQSWIGEDWYREVVWFKSYELTKKEKGSHQLANRIRRKAACQLPLNRTRKPISIFGLF